MLKKIKTILLAAMSILAIAGCSGQDSPSGNSAQASESRAAVQSSGVAVSSTPDAAALQTVSGETADSPPEAGSTAANENVTTSPSAIGTSSAATTARELTVHFGDNGAPFTMHLYDNSTAAAIAGYVGTADWRLPIYNYDGYENWEVMQYYDLPSRYEIPSNAEAVTTEKAGEVFYSEPNRIVLFYGDAEVTGEYSRIGYFEATEEFVSAVQNNPVLEGWGNKIVLITAANQ